MKEPHFYGNLGPEKSLPAIINPEKHRIHRNILNSLFSKQAVFKKYPLVMEKVDRALEFIRRRAETNSPIEIELLFRRVTVSLTRCIIFVLISQSPQMDVVSRSLFGHSFNLIDSDDEFPPELKMLADFVGDSGLIKHFPILKLISLALPSCIDTSVLKGYAYFKRVRTAIRKISCEISVAD